MEKARSIIEEQGASKGTLRISNVAAVLAKEHGFDNPENVRTRFFERLDKRMDETGPDKTVTAVIRQLKQEGLGLGIVTFVRKPRIERRLEVWQLTEYFDTVMTPDDESDFKPSPRPFMRAMGQIHARPHECFVVGDEPVDMIGGKKAKATTIGIPQGFFTKQELENAGADHIVNALTELPRIVDSSKKDGQ